MIVQLGDDLLSDKTAMLIMSLVAVLNDKYVGHILFTIAMIIMLAKMAKDQSLQKI